MFPATHRGRSGARLEGMGSIWLHGLANHPQGRSTVLELTSPAASGLRIASPLPPRPHSQKIFLSATQLNLWLDVCLESENAGGPALIAAVLVINLNRMGAVTSPEAPKSRQIFIKKRVAPTLFYKFYKFRGKYFFIFRYLQVYRGHMGTENGHMGTENGHMGTENSIYKRHLVLLLCPYDQDHTNRR